jgi:hypothetical protein
MLHVYMSYTEVALLVCLKKMLPVHISVIKIELISCLEIFVLPESNASHTYDLILGQSCSFVFPNFYGVSYMLSQ